MAATADFRGSCIVRVKRLRPVGSVGFGDEPTDRAGRQAGAESLQREKEWIYNVFLTQGQNQTGILKANR